VNLTEVTINQAYVDRIWEGMRNYRPGMRRETVVAILKITLLDEQPPYGESWNDVWTQYKKLESEGQ